jgi:hypothetical protein
MSLSATTTRPLFGSSQPESSQKSPDEAYIDRQAALFEQHKPELLQQYEGKYVVFEDGKVLAAGDNRALLAVEQYRQGGMRPLFIEKVTLVPEPPAQLWTPFPAQEGDGRKRNWQA